MTIADQIVALLSDPMQTPLQQIDIASRLGLIEASVRRTVQQLQKTSTVYVADYRGTNSTPRFLAGRRPVINTAPVDTLGLY